jgi:hypothetical protein
MRFMADLKRQIQRGIDNVRDRSFMMATSQSTTYESLVGQARALEEMSQISVSKQTKNLYIRTVAKKSQR